ncbi:hypothetical protein [Cellulosimicrobium sp. TH-20]|uniref:hypothetical protein n=1 Tax=Cellulosimicrobium sp. TH-20 TaxID=1980001 RepID=UPI0011A6C061|nr:hypothetical protein [Cellulosimicrobium sp. TH-20]
MEHTDPIVDAVSEDVRIETHEDEHGFVLDVLPDNGDGLGVYLSRETAEVLAARLIAYARGPRL